MNACVHHDQPQLGLHWCGFLSVWYWHERVENCAAGCVNLPSAPAEFHHFEFSSCILCAARRAVRAGAGLDGS
eukprot:COSAG04_NODE_2639_length_3822_cov_1.627720_2_plen_73_part_00